MSLSPRVSVQRSEIRQHNIPITKQFYELRRSVLGKNSCLDGLQFVHRANNLNPVELQRKRTEANANDG